jgi:hypothetical protein
VVSGNHIDFWKWPMTIIITCTHEWNVTSFSFSIYRMLWSILYSFLVRCLSVDVVMSFVLLIFSKLGVINALERFFIKVTGIQLHLVVTHYQSYFSAFFILLKHHFSFTIFSVFMRLISLTKSFSPAATFLALKCDCH